MIILDFKDARPIYEQVIAKLKRLILKGVLSKDEQIPSVRSLAMELSVNPNTIQKAYAELERQGYIYTVKGRGNFVSDCSQLLKQGRSEISEKLILLYEEARELGIGKSEWNEMVRRICEEASDYDVRGGENDRD